jgi:enamine deaminase RidA (YjgF/YER057c/UK114 family)
LAPLGSTTKLLRILLVLACALSLLSGAPQRKKSKKEEQTQTLQVPQELPGAVTGETRRLTFHVTPLSAKGLLSQQIKDALKAVARDSGNETVLKIRAFVAGSGDLRRVRDLVSESFTEHHQPLPSLSLIQSGGLPLEGAQVILEYVASSRKELHPQGLAFLSAQPAYSDNPTDPIPPLTAKSLAALRQTVNAAGSEPSDVLRVSCFLSSLENLGASRDQVVSEYPKASLNFVQTERAPAQAMAACEAVAGLRRKIEAPLQFVNVEGIPQQPGESQAALVASPHVVLTGSQVSFGYEEKDARLAFERLKRAIDQAGATTHDVAFAHYYPLSRGIAAQVRKIRAEFFDVAHPPAGSLLIFESLPSMDAGFAVDVVAVKN